MALRRLSGQTIDPGDGGSTVASMGDMGAGSGMLIVETIAKIRRAYFTQKKPKAIYREFQKRSAVQGLAAAGQPGARAA
jgi:hypothetical protein